MNLRVPVYTVLHLVQFVLVSMFCEKRVRVCSAGVRMLFTRYGLLVSSRSLNEMAPQHTAH